MEPMFLIIACPYVGTYILFSQTHDTEQPLATISSPSLSHRPNSLQQRPSANASSASRSTGAETGNQRALGASVPPTDYDSDDPQVKKKTKVAALEWQGKTFYVTGKESALHILRETYSVRSLMEDGQLQLLVHHVGDFVNNYTADVFKMGIIRRHSKSALWVSRGRKVEFGVAICISDLAKHYNVKTKLEACKPDCPYVHYDQLPPNVTSASVMTKVKKIIGKLNLTDAQSQQFLRRIETDSKFK
jgi:hypothetical protein